jgi:DNA-binding NtrC family response regulator
MREIILADDDGLMRALCAEWLGAAGYRVRQAENGAQALALLRATPAAVLITDMDMPGRDGAQTLREARSMHPGLVVIAISGGNRGYGHNWAAAALGQGAARTLAKPFTREVLLAAVRQVLPPEPSGADPA